MEWLHRVSDIYLGNAFWEAPKTAASEKTRIFSNARGIAWGLLLVEGTYKGVSGAFIRVCMGLEVWTSRAFWEMRFHRPQKRIFSSNANLKIKLDM